MGMTVPLLAKECSTFSGAAYNERHEHLFTEEYTIEQEGSKILNVTTRFLSPQGTLIAEMSSSFPHNNHLAVVHFAKKEESNTYGTLLLDNTIELFTTTAAQLRKQKTIPITDNMVSGHGFYFYILEHLDALLAGEKRQLVFLQPNRLSFYTFNMKALPQQDHLVKVILTIDSRLLKAFVPEIILVIDRRTNTLISYEGLSGFLAPEEGALKKISVTYTTPKHL